MKNEIRIGIVGCAEGTHGRVWAEMLTKGAGKKFGMRPARLWDEEGRNAEALTETTGASAVRDFREAGRDVDGVLITELFPARYLELSRPFLEAGMRVFFNRPFAGSMKDAREIVRLAERHGAKIYSASALFHTLAARRALRELPAIGPVRLFSATGASDNVSLYLPHAIASVASVLGPDVAAVRALSLDLSGEDPHGATAPVVIYVEYAGGARGVIQMIGPEAKWYGFRLKIFGAQKEAEEIRFEVAYDLLLETMAEFFRTGVEPVPHDVILKKTAVFYAALASAREGGRRVEIAELLGK